MSKFHRSAIRLITSLFIVLILSLVAAADDTARVEWLKLEQDGITVEYRPDSEVLARKLLPQLSARMDSSKCSVVPPEIARLRVRKSEVLKFLSKSLGMSRPGKQMQSVYDKCLDVITAEICNKPLTHFRVWRQEELLKELSAGGDVPGIAFHPSTEVFTLNLGARVSMGDKTSVRAVSSPVPIVMKGDPKSANTQDALDGIDRYLANHSKVRGALAAGMICHEAAEAGVAGDLKLRGRGRRWFAEGLANYLAIRCLSDFVSVKASDTFARSYDVANYKDLVDHADLLGWQPAEQEYRPISSRMREALYAFSTEEVRGLIERHGSGIVPKILHELAVSRKAGQEDAVVLAVKKVTGEDLQEALGKYGRKAREEALRSGFRFGSAIEESGGEWRLDEETDAVPLIKDSKHGLIIIFRHEPSSEIVKLKAVLTAPHTSGITPDYDTYKMDIQPGQRRIYITFRFDPTDDYEPGPAILRIYLNEKLFKEAHFRIVNPKAVLHRPAIGEVFSSRTYKHISFPVFSGVLLLRRDQSVLSA